MVQTANSSENSLANRGRLESITITWLSFTAILTSHYFLGVLFLNR